MSGCRWALGKGIEQRLEIRHLAGERFGFCQSPSVKSLLDALWWQAGAGGQQVGEEPFAFPQTVPAGGGKHRLAWGLQQGAGQPLMPQKRAGFLQMTGKAALRPPGQGAHRTEAGQDPPEPYGHQHPQCQQRRPGVFAQHAPEIECGGFNEDDLLDRRLINEGEEQRGMIVIVDPAVPEGVRMGDEGDHALASVQAGEGR